MTNQINNTPLFIDIVDIKPVNMEELTEVITATEFHPTQCNLFMYSSSKSNIKLADMRDSALCDRHAKCASPEARGAFLIDRFVKVLRRKRTPVRDPFSPRSSLRYRT